MLPHTIKDYIDTMMNPFGVFRSLGEVDVERDPYGQPIFRAGNSAAIFTRYIGRGRRRFIKCYIRPNPHLRTVYNYIARQKPPLLPNVRLLPGELFVHSHSGEAGWVDIVEGEWTDGETLSAAVARAAKTDDPGRMTKLATAFDELATTLESQEWAHGDLKPENIVVTGSVKRSLVAPIKLKLIDCDAMWIPALTGVPAAELGTPPYSDPARTAANFDKNIDRHAIGVISTALHTLAEKPEARAKYKTFEEFLQT
jgi:serine/threonine protein kinase